uniref:Uncharacterized protein n=1 Tax=Arundo donax TaxID=35708 RepID=A0A0A9BM70_ARUDO
MYNYTSSHRSNSMHTLQVFSSYLQFKTRRRMPVKYQGPINQPVRSITLHPC